MAKQLNDMTAPAKDARSFDLWFYAQSQKARNKMREAGVLPYVEMKASRQVFPIYDNHKDWGVENTASERTETDTFILRDHVGAMLSAFIDALACTHKMTFRRHVELIRWALSLPGCLDSRSIGTMHGKSHDWVQYRGKEIRETVHPDALGHFSHTNLRRDKHKTHKHGNTPRKTSL